MADYLSDRFALPLLYAAQAQKEITHNEALALIDMLLHAQAESATLAVPPSMPAVGQCWIVAEGASDDWMGQEGALACFTSGGWRFAVARSGLRVFVSDESVIYVHNGSSWALDTTRQDGLYFEDKKIVGTRQGAISEPSAGSTIDIEARETINLILMTLRNHGLIEMA